jgi:hypothetical protein
VLALGGQPRGMAVAGDGTVAAVATDKAVLLVRRSGAAWRVASSTPAAFGAQSVALSPDMQVTTAVTTAVTPAIELDHPKQVPRGTGSSIGLHDQTTA